MRIRLTILLLSVCFINTLKAQYLEVGTTFGATSSISDLQPNQPTLGSFGATYGAVARLHFSPMLSFKASAMAGSFYATDRYSKGSRRYRNLEAQTQYYELAATAEWNITKYDVLDGKLSAPYLFAGVAGFYFNPKARTGYGKNATWVSLRPLGTEGQTLEGGKLYSPLQVAIPVGLGLKMSVNARINIGFEAGVRYTFTDYLDDISGNYPNLATLYEQNPTAAALSFRMTEVFGNQLELPSGLKRGDSYKNDLYYYCGMNLTINLCDKRQMEFNKSYRSFWNNN